jgi:hypothetical protein
LTFAASWDSLCLAVDLVESSEMFFWYILIKGTFFLIQASVLMVVFVAALIVYIMIWTFKAVVFIIAFIGVGIYKLRNHKTSSVPIKDNTGPKDW